MLLNIPLVADLEAIRDRRQVLIDENLCRANAKCRHYDYQVNDLVWYRDFDPSKLDPRAEGPYRILRVHANGTVTVALTPHVTERINIRRIKPCRR